MRAPKIRVLLTQQEIAQKVKGLAEQVSRDYQGKKPLLVCILKGAVVFFSDFMRCLQLPVEIDFMSVSSYGKAKTSTGTIRIMKDLEMNIKNRDVIVIEDIVDTGLTLSYLRENLLTRGPRSLRMVTLLDKPDRREVDIEADYCGFCIPDEFVVGYGLDFNEKYRYLSDICILLEFRS